MFFLNFIEFLYYHVKLLGKRRGTAWDKGWDGYLYAIFPMAMMYLSSRKSITNKNNTLFF